jgi:hypothetical protein
MSKANPYLAACRHPWPCFLFVLPLLLLYEVAVLVLGKSETTLNGAHYWLLILLQGLGLKFFWIPPLLLLLIFAIWIYRRRDDKPGDLAGVLSGISIESVAFALGLWGVSRLLAPVMKGMGLPLSLASEVDPSLRQLVPYLGAGIYEEVLFRLMLYSAMFWLLRKIDVIEGLACFLAAVGSATLFSAAHNLGPYGNTFRPYQFTFLLLAGLYFALLYHFRGFGVAVGAHACYNLMISVGTL